MTNPIKLQWHHAFLAFLIAGAGQFIFGLALFVVAFILSRANLWAPPGLASQPPWLITVQLAVSQLIFVGAAVVSAKVAGVKLKEVTFHKPCSIQTVLLGLVGVVAVGILADQITAWASNLLPWLFDKGLITQLAAVFQKSSFSEYILLSFFIVVGPAIAEELLFRGVVLRSLLSSWPGIWAIAMSSVLFGAIHFNFFQGLGAGLLGLWLGFLVYKTGSLWPAVIAHGFNNLLVSVVTRYDSEGLGNTAVSGHPPLTLTGALLITALCAFGIWKTTNRRRKREDLAA